MKSVLLKIVASIILILPALQWAQGVVNPVDIFNHQLPPGQWFYLVSKLVAQYAFLLLTFQLALGVLFANKATEFSLVSIATHRALGITVFLTVFLHAGLFVLAAWYRTGHFPFEAITPEFSKGYYTAYVSLGVISACLLSIVFLFGLCRKHLPKSFFLLFHRMAWLVWILGIGHSYAIGTEINSGLAWAWYYLFVALVIALLMIYRIFLLLSIKRFSPVLLKK